MRRASGAARIVAREFLAQLGYAELRVPQGRAGEPLWPAGIAGSLAHDDRSRSRPSDWQREIGAIGIDIEPADAVAAGHARTGRDAARAGMIDDDPVAAKLLFAAKEAVYKAVYPLRRRVLRIRATSRLI